MRLQSADLPDVVGEPRAFLYKMAYNLANDRTRAARRRVVRDQGWQDANTHSLGHKAPAEAIPVADTPAVEDAIDARRRLERVMAWIAELPPRCREVFTLHRLREVPHQQIAAQLGISTKAVEKHMANAFRILGQKNADTDGKLTGRGTDGP